MILRTKTLTLILIIPSLSASAQKLKKADKLLLANLEAHVHYLADDKLEGRRAGTAGEKLASDYISVELMKAGLRPRGDNNGWLQAFGIDEGRQVGPATHFIVNDHEFVLNKEYFPFAFSPSASLEGSPAVALQESGEPWFLDLKDMMESGQDNPHFDLEEAIRAKTGECRKKGATALVLYNSSKIPDNLRFEPRDRSETTSIPVIYITREAKKKYLRDESASLEIKLKLDFTEKMRTGHNVVGYLDNGASNTVIIGAHYDHLGHGEDSNSLYRGPGNPVFHGADDNASGVAGIIELARMLKGSRLTGNNYLFIAFSGEEIGLFGSKYFVEHPGIDLGKVNYMINLDMIGRLNDSSHVLNIGGYGTSPAWAGTFSSVSDKKYFVLKYDSSGIGPSDHTSFYMRNIPVLFFFTGIHADYHKPTDDYDKVNYMGELQVLKYIYNVVENVNNKGRIAFTKTLETPPGGTYRFSVTLGILPDYAFGGAGVRADGVSEGRPAGKAGLKAGDIIIQLGDYTVSSLERYMEALSKFKKGDTITVKYRRGNDVMAAPVQF